MKHGRPPFNLATAQPGAAPGRGRQPAVLRLIPKPRRPATA